MITVVGEALIDMMSEPGSDIYRAAPGGSPANVAVAIARLGYPAQMLARLSLDPFGRRLHAHLAASGVDLSAITHAPQPTSLAIATLDRDGRASYSFYLDGAADWQWTEAELSGRPDRDSVAVHTGSLALGLDPGASALERWLARAADQTVSIDLNLRPSIRPDRVAEQARVARQIRYAHIVKASDEDLEWLYPGQPIPAIAASWREAGVACVIVTLGARGAYLLAPDGVAHHQTARPVDVVDTVGAGDSYTGAFLVALAGIDALGDRPAERLAAVTPQEWLSVLDHAGAAAAITCSRRGADPPTRADLAR